MNACSPLVIGTDPPLQDSLRIFITLNYMNSIQENKSKICHYIYVLDRDEGNRAAIIIINKYIYR